LEHEENDRQAETCVNRAGDRGEHFLAARSGADQTIDLDSDDYDERSDPVRSAGSSVR
jgi:hypothetical protein